MASIINVSLYQLVYGEQWKQLPNVGFKANETIKYSLLLSFGLNYTSKAGKICVQIKNRLKR